MNSTTEDWGDRLLAWLLQGATGENTSPQELSPETTKAPLSPGHPANQPEPLPPFPRVGTPRTPSWDPTLFLDLLHGDPLMTLQDQGSMNDQAQVYPADRGQRLPWESSRNPQVCYQPMADLSRSSGLESLDLGEGFMMEDRFYALLKRRMRAEIEAKPPLFPWESEVLDYEDVTVAWLPQLQAIQLPVALPEPLLQQLFVQCQDLVQTVHQSGRQLVQSVQALLSASVLSQTDLPTLAQAVALGSSRDDGSVPTYLLGSQTPATYQGATPQQQAIIALLAARQLLQQLTLVVSPQLPRTGRTWDTEVGLLEMTATYWEPIPTQGTLDLWVDLPVGGSLVCQAGDRTFQVNRATPGSLHLVVPSVPLDSCYGVDVWLEGAEAPLKWAVRVESNALD